MDSRASRPSCRYVWSPVALNRYMALSINSETNIYIYTGLGEVYKGSFSDWYYRTVDVDNTVSLNFLPVIVTRKELFLGYNIQGGGVVFSWFFGIMCYLTKHEIKYCLLTRQVS